MTMSWMRPEARPLQLEVLDYYQEQAIEKISGVLLEALRELGNATKKETSKKELDSQRASRLFFLSGEAGGGKTTVYLSLRQALEKGADPPAERFPRLRELLPDRKKLIWLEPLDLEPAPEAGNFLAATLVRMEQALLPKGRRAEKADRRRGVLELDSDEARQSFESLLNDVVLAWEGNLRQRAEHIDPEVYSLEVVRTARASLGLNHRLQQTLEGMLAKDEDYRDSLLVLPVDDFYLNPSASLELLRLLRMVSIPRLFVLILGDYIVIEELFYQDMLGKLIGMAGEQAFLRLNRQRERLTSMATALAARSLRKLVPAAQSYRLQVMYQLYALEFTPDMLELDYVKPKPGQSGQKDTLEELLGQLLLSPEMPRKNPANLLKFLRLRTTEEERSGHQYYTYSGLAVLDLPPREVADLWYSAKRALEEPPEPEEQKADEEKTKKKMEARRRWKATLGLVVGATFDAIAAQDYLTKDEQELCNTAISGSHDAYEKSFETYDLRVTPNLKETKIELKDGGTIVLSELRGWRFYPKHSKRKDPDFMAPRPTAWMTVLHDLMALSGENRLIGDPLVPYPCGFGIIRVTQGAHHSSVWPTPRWTSFRDFDRLGFAWRNVVKTAKEGMKNERSDVFVAWLAFYWMRYIVDILLENGGELKDQSMKRLAEKDWKSLGEDLKKLRDPKRPLEDRVLINEWLLCLAAEPALRESIRKVLQPFRDSKDAEIQAIRKKLEESPAL